MRIIEVSEIIRAIKNLCIEAAYDLNEEMLQAFDKAYKNEISPTGKLVLNELIENAKIAKEERIPYCQDTGFAVLFIDIGQEVQLTGGKLNDAVNEGVKQGYEEGYLRKSICDPFTRQNTKTNTPAIIHYDIVEGDKIKIYLDAKGGGSENMSGVAMLKPSEGIEGVKKFVLKKCFDAGSNPCPPIIVGIGIGGTMEKAAILAKKALLRPLNDSSDDERMATLEQELLNEINNIGHGPQGLGGRNFCLAVKINIHPCHIASLPVAMNIDCHAHRHKHITI